MVTARGKAGWGGQAEVGKRAGSGDRKRLHIAMQCAEDVLLSCTPETCKGS